MSRTGRPPAWASCGEQGCFGERDRAQPTRPNARDPWPPQAIRRCVESIGVESREIDPFLDNLRRLAERVAAALNGRAVLEDGLVGSVSSAFDRFFNHVFATGVAALGKVEAALAGRPGFVWLCDDDAAAGARTGGANRPVRLMHGMRTTIPRSGVDKRTPASVTAVSSFDDLADWHAVYRGVFAVDPRSLDDWRRVHLALGPTGDDSLVLHLARVEGSAAATAAAFFDRNVVGLYAGDVGHHLSNAEFLSHGSSSPQDLSRGFVGQGSAIPNGLLFQRLSVPRTTPATWSPSV